MKPKTWWERWRITTFMVLVLLLGVSMLFGCSLYLQKWAELKFVVDSLAVAIIIAGILGLTIDRLFRQQFAEDAFRASIGYVLPSELKGEMEWLYNCHIICIEHIQKCELLPIDDETCAVRVNIQRKLRNVSGSKDEVRLNVWIDEWFHKTGSSKIISFGYNKGGKRWSAGGEDIGKGEDATLRTTDQTVSLEPGEEITTWHEIEEIKRVNDVHTWVFRNPTLNPLVSIKAYEGIQITAGFGYRVPSEQLSADSYRLPGTLLADQAISIRWWKVEDLNKWLGEDKNSE